MSVGYVFIHLLPELAEHQETLSEAASGTFGFLERHVYLIAALGLATFYGLERMTKSSREEEDARAKEDQTSSAVFWIHIGSFAIYNVLIGYVLLHREQPGMLSLVLFAIAMALHFLVNDFGLRQDHREVYHDRGRWVLAGAVLGGWIFGYLLEISDAALAVVIAFLAGGVILNVLKEELPEERQSRFWAFALGMVGYAALLLAI